MSNRTLLTDVILRQLTPPSYGQMEVWDSKIPGFGIRITHNGTKSFVVMYRHRGKARRLTLGRYPELKLIDARQGARDAIANAGKGVDPQSSPENQPTKSQSFTVVVDQFLALHCARQNRAASAKETERLLKVEFLPHWRNYDVAEIRKHDVLQIIDDIVKRGSPSGANHAFAAIRKFFNWCVERGLIETTPCLGVKMPTKHRSRDRVLEDGELAAICQIARDMGYPFGTIVQLLALTAQRRGEVAGMRWEDLNFTDRTWSIPAELNKAGRAHVVPLHDQAVHLLRQLPRLDDRYVFPARGTPGQTYVGFAKGKGRLDARLSFSNWTLHDLRRTAASGMARHKVPPHVVERILNHVSGTFGGVAGVYNRFGYLDEMREALSKWGDHVRTITDNYKNNDN
jgi:integrase